MMPIRGGIGRDRLSALCVVLLLLLAAGADPLQKAYREALAGHKAFEEERWEDALRHYTEAQAELPDDPRIVYNLGTTLARLGRADEARQAWERAAELDAAKRVSRDAFYNHGLADMESEAYAEAAKNFAQALTLDPNDSEAQRNLELALRRLQQPPPQQEQNSSQNEDQESQKQNQDQQERKGQAGKEERQEQPENTQDSRESEQDQDEQQNQPPEQKQDESNQDPQDQEEQQRQGRESDASGGPEDAEQNPDAQMAERVLESVERGEEDALKKALRKKAGNTRPRKKPW